MKKQETPQSNLTELEQTKDEILAKIAAKIQSSGEDAKMAGYEVAAGHASHSQGSKHNSVTH